MKKNLITMLLITILLSTILSTVYANDNFFIIIDQTREAYKKANYEAVMSYLNKMNEIVKSKIGNNEPETWKMVKSWKGNGLKNTEPFTINPGERIAQIMLNKIEKIEWEVVEQISDTERGEGKFGSTGR